MKSHRPNRGRAPQASAAAGAGPAMGAGSRGPARGQAGGRRGNAFAQAQSQTPALASPGPEQDAAAPQSAAATRVAGQEIDSGATSDLYKRVGATPRGSELLKQLDASGGRATLTWSGQGSYMMGGQVWLDTELPEHDLVDVLVHELQHVLNAREGRTGDLGTNTREEYVDKSLNDECLAEAAMVVTSLQAGANSTTGKIFLHHLRMTDPALAAAVSSGSPDVDWAAIEVEARVWVRNKFETEYTTSTTGEAYPAYYGGQWDRARGGASSGGDNASGGSIVGD